MIVKHMDQEGRETLYGSVRKIEKYEQVRAETDEIYLVLYLTDTSNAIIDRLEIIEGDHVCIYGDTDKLLESIEWIDGCVSYSYA